MLFRKRKGGKVSYVEHNLSQFMHFLNYKKKENNKIKNICLIRIKPSFAGNIVFFI